MIPILRDAALDAAPQEVVLFEAKHSSELHRGDVGQRQALVAIATAILKLIRKPGRRGRGRVVFEGRDLCDLGESELGHIRGAQIALIAQTPRTSLNPVDEQVARLFALHAGLSKAESRRRAIDMLRWSASRCART